MCVSKMGEIMKLKKVDNEVLHKFYSLGNIGNVKLRSKKCSVQVARMGEKFRQENLKK